MKQRISNLLAYLALTLFIISCFEAKNTALDNNQILYFGGDILTMQGTEPNYVEAIVTNADSIVFIGRLSESKELFPSVREVNLNGKTLLPGFIDAHAHFAGFPSQSIGAQILPPPDAGANNISSLIKILKAWSTPENIQLTGWIFGMGFDDSVLAEKRFPTKEDLDKVSTEHPVMIIHISGHFCVVNSKGLELLDITSETPNPEGGIIRRISGTEEPNGVLEELAAIPIMPMVLGPKSEEALKSFLISGQDMALSYGYTTVQEGRAMPSSHLFLEHAAMTNFLKLDVVSYIDYSVADSLLNTDWYSSSYKNHYRIGGVKLTLDGSPQGRTAWRTLPYLIAPDGAEEGYLGYPAIPNDKDVEDIYENAFRNNWQIHTHANGDAAMDQMIRTLKKVTNKYGNEGRRDVLIHGQYVREDQLDEFKNLDIIASLFPLHTFYWGDWHKELIGDSLGNKISPTRTALNKGLKITIHTDAPVALPNLMRVIWTATNRVSRSGNIIGENERLTPYEALKCITEWSAYQHFEEESKGTLEVGKLADLVILDSNPIKVDIENIKNIVVLQTIKEGSTVYKKETVANIK
ncbi:amidohydrolase [uncultured Algibacter sp.]|jgi:predicted amidohydrolase YtcJ|uniref:amidohydrolase n=1 Tax=uncultured Algibacter sp. TaxID=298659 RepID=UPI0025DF2C2A|nr:amidohydrolase [uncultured Algibacter sp.]MDC1197218.1 amidohydrolase [Algibacter sp.]